MRGFWFQVELVALEVTLKTLLRAEPFTTRVKTPDSSKAKRDLGFKLAVPVEEGIKRTVEWFKRFYGKSGDALAC